MALLTVFTPAFNRKSTLKRTYQSLCAQTSKDFIWMIIDDGSTDNTDVEVKKWIENTEDFEIKYYYKENGGLHTTYNEAIKHADTELMVCIDSDDFMPENAVELICDTWEKRGNKSVAGIVGLDFYADGGVVGTMLPNTETINLIDVCVGKVFVNGDKKQVVRTDLFKKAAPMPVYKGEKNFNPYYLILKIAENYEFLVLNENLCWVDYQSDGMTANQYKQYVNSPNSFFEIRKQALKYPGRAKYVFRNSIHLVSSAILAKRRGWLTEVNHKAAVIICTPLGYALSLFLKMKTRGGKKMCKEINI